MTARVPPNDVQAEESLLGAMLLDRRAIEAAFEAGLSAEAFYKPAHGHIFTAVAGLFGRGDPSDPVTVADELRRAGHLDLAGGPAALVSLQAGTPSIGNAGRYARIVADHSLLRRLIRAAGDIAEMGYGLPDDVAAIVDEAEQRIFDLRPQESTAPEGHGLGVIGAEWRERIAELAAGGGAIASPLGWHDLDELTGGLRPGLMVVVGGRPGSGKTSWAGALASNVARRGEPVLVVSAEMSRLDVYGRLMSAQAQLVGSELERGRVNPKDWSRIDAGAAELGRLPLDLIDTTPVTILALRTWIRRAMSHYGHLGLVVIDYLQLMSGIKRAENRQVELAQMSRDIKLMAGELAVPIVVLCQLSQALESRADKRPMLSDLRESGAPANDADLVIGVYREEMYNPQTEDRGVAELGVIKNRFGAQGVARLHADLPRHRWADLTRREAI